MLESHGIVALAEVRLGNHRRADVMGLDDSGRFVIVEIKSSLADYRADRKWPDYLPYCDKFYFAVDSGFPQRELSRAEAWPERTGLIVADAFSGAVLREAAEAPLSPGRRRALLVRFARMAASRFQQLGGNRSPGESRV